MKTLIIASLLLSCSALVSCDNTNKQSNQTKSPDTMVMKKDTAIKRTDTLGFSK